MANRSDQSLTNDNSISSSPQESQNNNSSCSSSSRGTAAVSPVNNFVQAEKNIFSQRKIITTVFVFGAIYFVLGKIFNYAEAQTALNMPFLTGGLILTIAEFSMSIYLLSLGFLSFLILHYKKEEIQRYMDVINGERWISFDGNFQAIIGFIVVVLCLPPWLYLRDYSVSCLWQRNCLSFLSIFQSLTDCACGPYSDCRAPTLCQAVMLFGPICVLTIVPTTLSLYVYFYYYKHRHRLPRVPVS